MTIMISPSEPYDIKKDLGDYGFSTPALPVDYGWFVKGIKSLVERKAIPGDLLASMSDGRLARESQALIENIEKGGRSYLLLEGSLQCDREGKVMNGFRSSGWQIENVSAQISTIQNTGIQLLLSPSIKQTAVILVSQYRWELKGEHSSLRKRPGLSESWGGRPSYSNYIMWSYQGMPMVGSGLAETLYDVCPTWEKLIFLSQSDFTEIKGFGKKRAERIWKFLHEGKL